MIEEEVKIHDKFSVEIKLGYKASSSGKNDFAVNMWLFYPNTLDINNWTYSKADFYRDLKSNTRLITPVYRLDEVADRNREPYKLLEHAFRSLLLPGKSLKKPDIIYHLRMFLSILKSSLRNETKLLINSDEVSKDELVEAYVVNVNSITSNFRILGEVVRNHKDDDDLLNYYLFGDEFMSNLVEQYSFKLLEGLAKENDDKPRITKMLVDLVNQEIEYRKQNSYPTVDQDSQDNNRHLVSRLGLLKKYAENELFLTVNKRREGVLKEHVYLSLAAGIAMIFATAVAFIFQKEYGSFTMPFFVALVVSYMLKDRIKELVRYYLAHRVGRGFFDHKTKIALNETSIGWSKEGMDFVSEKKVPGQVMKIRKVSQVMEGEDKISKEQILLYRKLVRLNRKKLEEVSPFNIEGMNDILRFSVFNYTQKMDDPVFQFYAVDDSSKLIKLEGEKVYYLNMIIQFKDADSIRYRRYQIVMNREGIIELENYEF